MLLLLPYVDLEISDVVDNVAVSASLNFVYTSTAFVIHGKGSLEVSDLHDDGDSLFLSMYPFFIYFFIFKLSTYFHLKIYCFIAFIFFDNLE